MSLTAPSKLSSSSSSSLSMALSRALLRRTTSSSSSSILPILPRPVRWLLVLIALLNYRALPGVWHLRVFWSIITIRLRGLLKWSDHSKRRQFVKELSPIGENPFDICVTYKTTVGLTDTDYNGHLSNSSYAKNLDYARMRAAVVCFPSVLEAKGWLGLGSSHFYFIKEIPLLAEYEIRINIGGWDNKWLNLVVQFVTYPNGRKDSRSRGDDSTPTGTGTTTIGSGGTGSSTPSIEEQPLAYTPPTRYYVPAPVAGDDDDDETCTALLAEGQEQDEPEDEDFCATGASIEAEDSFTSSGSGSIPSSSSVSSSSEPGSRSTSDSSFTTQSSESGEDCCFLVDEEEEGKGEGHWDPSGSSTAASSPPCSSPYKTSMTFPSSQHPLSSNSSSSLKSPRPTSSLSQDLPPSPSTHDSQQRRTKAKASRPTHVPSSLLNAMPALPEGALLHCIHVSSYCFKHGRITIPPRVALVVSGFGDPQRKRWDRVQDIRDTKKNPIHPVYLSSSSSSSSPSYPATTSDSTTSTSSSVSSAFSKSTSSPTKKKEQQQLPSWTGLQAILRGGWRQYEHEGLWDLPEYEDQRLIALEAFGNLRAQMTSLQPGTPTSSSRLEK